MMTGYKFWATFRVVVLRRGFDSSRTPLSLVSLSLNGGLGGGGNVLWCG